MRVAFANIVTGNENIEHYTRSVTDYVHKFGVMFVMVTSRHVSICSAHRLRLGVTSLFSLELLQAYTLLYMHG